MAQERNLSSPFASAPAARRWASSEEPPPGSASAAGGSRLRRGGRGGAGRGLPRRLRVTRACGPADGALGLLRSRRRSCGASDLGEQ